MKKHEKSNEYHNGPLRRNVPKKWMKVHEPKWVSMPWHIHVLPLRNNPGKASLKLSAFTSTLVWWVYINFCMGGQWDGILFWLTVLKPRLVWGDLIFCSADSSGSCLDLKSRRCLQSRIYFWCWKLFLRQAIFADLPYNPPKERQRQG